MGETIRVVTADDHPLVRCGIRETLRAADDIVLMGEASRGDEAQRLCQELQPDVLLLDLQMPGATAVETVTYVHRQCSAVKIIILTAYDDEVYVRRMLMEGVDGYVLKDEVMDAVVSATRSVMQGGTWISRRVLSVMATQRPTMQSVSAGDADGGKLTSVSRPAHLPLTRQQRKVLRLIEEGLTNSEVADRLCISPRTVKKHVEDIFKRLDAHDRSAAVRVAREYGCLK